MNKGRRNFTLAACGAALIAGLAGPALALGPQVGLNDTPGARFNNDDLALMKARIDQGLKADKDFYDELSGDPAVTEFVDEL